MLLIVAGILVKVLVFPSTDAPTRETSRTGFMDVIEVDAKITDVLDAAPSGTGNAADHYAQAVALFVPNYERIKDAAADLGAGNVETYTAELKIMEEIRGHVGTGAQQASMDYLGKHASGKLKVSTNQEDIMNLSLTLNTLDILGEYYIKNKRLKDANATYRDMFVAGWHMINDRSHIRMAMDGEVTQGDALQGMIESIDSNLDEDARRQRIAALKNYNYALNEYRSTYEEKEKIFRKARLDAGDMWNIAENDKDRAWRVQAILAMGIMRFTHLKKTNIARNNALIEKFLNSSDPLEKAAAQAAKAYTEIEFNMVSSTW
jgi:hypothetical protein